MPQCLPVAEHDLRATPIPLWELADLRQRYINELSLCIELRTLKFKMGAVYLVREQVGNQWLLDLVAHHGFSSTLVSSIQTLSLSEDTLGRFYSSEPVRWFPRNKVVFPKLRKRMAEESIHEIIAISLRSHQRVLGMLYVTNDGILQPRPDRTGFLTTIGQQIGVAMADAGGDALTNHPDPDRPHPALAVVGAQVPGLAIDAARVGVADFDELDHAPVGIQAAQGIIAGGHVSGRGGLDLLG